MGGDLQFYFHVRDDNRLRGHALNLVKPEANELDPRMQLSYRAVNLWNSLSVAVVEEDNDDRFKRLLDDHLRDMSSRSR